ncbi:Histone-fold [Penicillium expansum]|nr:Histone-fold [Penicillium expansum]
MQCRDYLARSLEELMLSDPDGTLTDPDMLLTDPDGTLTDPDMLLTDPDGTLTDLDMLLTDCTITSPANAPCADSAFDLDFSDDISMHSVEDVSGANQDHLLDDSESDFFSMEEFFHENYTQLAVLTREGLPQLQLRWLCIHIFNLLSVRIDSAVTSSETMIFVSGETAEPSAETATLIEEITRQQLTRSTALATRPDSDDKGGGDAADFAAADDAAGVVAGPQDVPEREDEEDEEEEQKLATLQRLTPPMNASFTYRKSERFREWAGFGIVTESKPNNDIVDILGFLTVEIVRALTEEALKVKEREDNEKHRRGGAEAGENLEKRKRETGLFDPPEKGRVCVEPRHVREAYRKLQATPKGKAMLLHDGVLLTLSLLLGDLFNAFTTCSYADNVARFKCSLTSASIPN